MPEVAVKRGAGLAYREVAGAGATGAPLLCVHGWPQSSYMWRHLLPAVAATGRRAVAPDLPGFGDSPPHPPGTWGDHVEALAAFHRDVLDEPVVLAVHDTGGAIGLRWACDRPDAVAGLVISNTGFFPDLEWHEIARTLRTPGQGEALVDSLSREALATLLQEAATGIDERAVDEYWKLFATPESRRAMLELYRSFDPGELEPYDGRLAALGVPALVLWGRRDDFLPADYAERFIREIPHADLVVLDTPHFLFEDEPERCAREVIGFLEGAGP